MKKYILLILLVAMVAGCVSQQPQFEQRQFAGQTFNFRSNLTAAAAVPVHPDETALSDALLMPDLDTVYIAFIPSKNETGIYGVVGYGLTFKLNIIYRAFFGMSPDITSKMYNSADEVNASAVSPGTRVILLRGPAAGANSTGITVDGNMVIVDGADLSQVNRNFNDLDLATEKLIMVAMQGPVLR